MITATFALPIIPAPPKGTAAVLAAGEGFAGPFFKGDGPVDLRCGKCLALLGHRLHPGQIQNIVLRCPSCASHNALVSVPTLESFATRLVAAAPLAKDIVDLHALLLRSQQQQRSAQDTVAAVAAELPDLSWIETFLKPSDAGDFYALLGVLIAFLAFFKTQRPATNPTVVVNNFLTASDPFRDVGRNASCPCGSGMKFKDCHGRNAS